MYTIEAPNAPEISGEGKPRRNKFFDGELFNDFTGFNSLLDTFEQGRKLVNGKGKCLGARLIASGVASQYVWQSYDEIAERMKSVGAGLVHLGIKKKENIGFYSVNRPEWVIGEYGCYLHCITTVPLYDTLGEQAIEYIVNETEMAVILCTLDKAKILLKLKKSLPTLTTLIIMDNVTEEIKKEAQEQGVSVFSFSDCESKGKENPQTSEPAALEDLATICYTSGTTGMPKGVLLSHRNLLSLILAMKAMSDKGCFMKLGPDDVHLSYLPLAHSLERIIEAYLLSCGSSIGFYRGDTRLIMEDLAALKPTLFPSVPRLFNRIYDKVIEGVKEKGGIPEFLFKTAYKQKQDGLKKGAYTHWLWDRIIFNNIREKLGGKVTKILTGSAPILPEIVEFLRICISADVYEGYGQTETGAGLTMTLKGDFQKGTVGIPIPCVEIKLVDLPEMNYTSKDTPYPRGEICARGANVFSGYHKQPEKTAEALVDGWCHTGDVGMWDEKGRLVVIDRAKNIFKLAQGEYIAPEKIESIYCTHELAEQAFVYGDSLKSTLVGIIVPNQPKLESWAKTQSLEQTFDELCRNDKVKQYVLEQLTKHGKENGLKGFENIRGLFLESRPFSVENEILTPTFKLKRKVALEKYKVEIESVYQTIKD